MMKQQETTRTHAKIRLGGSAILSSAVAAVLLACATNGASPEPYSISAAPDGAPPPTPDAPLSSTVDSGDASDADARTCAESPCDLAPQCGCGKGKTCDLDESGGRGCVTAGTTRAGFACLSTLECAEGLVCAENVCRVPCAKPGDACAGQGAGACSTYARVASDGGATGVSYAACPVTCAYDKEDSCGFVPGDLLAAACVYDAATDSVECRKVRNVQLQSGLCSVDADCGAGRVCVAGAGFSSCRRLCKPADSAACGGCKALVPARVVAGVTYGSCP